MLVMTESEIRTIIRQILIEVKRKKKKTKKKKKNNGKRSKKQAEKDLMLDKPFNVGGWPKGKHQGWLPDSRPVNIQIRDYLDDMGLL